VVAIFITYTALRDAKIKESSEAYFNSFVDGDPQKTVDNLTAVRAQYPGTPVARNAAYDIVTSLVTLGKYEEARTLLSELLGSLTPAEESVRILILNYLGALSEELGDQEGALKNYQEAKRISDLSSGPPDGTAAFRADLINSLARVSLALNKNDEAKAYFQELKRLYPETIRGYGADFRLGLLENLGPQTQNQPSSVPPSSGDAATTKEDPPSGGGDLPGDASAPLSEGTKVDPMDALPDATEEDSTLETQPSSTTEKPESAGDGKQGSQGTQAEEDGLINQSEAPESQRDKDPPQ
jgi:hypothetical protein